MTRRRHRKKGTKSQGISPKPRIALIGFRGIGKSAIARRLCEVWHVPLVSLDDEIERRAGMRIEEIVRINGWQHFRDLEYEELKRVAAQEKVLLDCGGGVVEEADGIRSERKMALLKENFFCVYIAASEEKLLQRLKTITRSASRPDLSGKDSPKSLLEVFRRREPLYLELAHAVVDVSDTNVAESAARITQLFK